MNIAMYTYERQLKIMRKLSKVKLEKLNKLDRLKIINNFINSTANKLNKRYSFRRFMPLNIIEFDNNKSIFETLSFASKVIVEDFKKEYTHEQRMYM